MGGGLLFLILIAALSDWWIGFLAFTIVTAGVVVAVIIRAVRDREEKHPK
jgi:hypothetical protein